MQYYDTIILGGGAAAFSAAIYGARYQMKTLLIHEEFGGETSSAGPIENYPGFKKIDGFELMQNMEEQAKDLGVEMVNGKAELAKNIHHCFQVRVGKELFEGKTLIIAVGMERRKMGLTNEDALKGKGIHYCVTCDGPLFKKKTVGIVGGGDSAVKGANQLADLVGEVYMIVREKDLRRAEPANFEQLKKKTNVKVLYETQILELVGEKKLKAIKLSKKIEGSDVLPLDAVFVAIGAVPRSTIPQELGIAMNGRGEIIVDRMMKTNVEGVFGAGDITDASGSFKQIVTAAAQGSIAATSAYDDVGTHKENVCALHAVPVVAPPHEIMKSKQ
ncbi:FAD-dependent oxidoreductase [Candidatus Uhrbacteria bacterium]|nr:FAD-dependent oxidoreductase [Candidatus Uhrbacteria bacterium]